MPFFGNCLKARRSKLDPQMAKLVHPESTKLELELAGSMGGVATIEKLRAVYASLSDDLRETAIVSLLQIGGRVAVELAVQIAVTGSAPHSHLALHALELLADHDSDSPRTQDRKMWQTAPDRSVYPINVLDTLAAGRNRHPDRWNDRIDQVLGALLAAFRPQLQTIGSHSATSPESLLECSLPASWPVSQTS